MSSRRMLSINKGHPITQLLLSFVPMNQTSLEGGGERLGSTRKYHHVVTAHFKGTIHLTLSIIFKSISGFIDTAAAVTVIVSNFWP